MDTNTKSRNISAPSGSGAFARARTLLLIPGDVERAPALGEIIVFDSSRTALQDVAAGAVVYRRALGQQQGVHFSFNA